MTPRVPLPAIVRQASPALVATSLFCWVLLYAASEELQSAPFCSSSQTLVTAGVAFSTIYGVSTTTVLATLLWIAMAVAMTAPLLAQPIAQLRLRSLTQRRNRSVGLFATAYLLIWIAVAPILLAIQKAIEMLAGATTLPAIVIAVAIAAAWQAAQYVKRAQPLPSCSKSLGLRRRSQLRLHPIWSGARTLVCGDLRARDVVAADSACAPPSLDVWCFRRPAARAPRAGSGAVLDAAHSARSVGRNSSFQIDQMEPAMIIGIPVYDKVDLLDVAGPREVLSWMQAQAEVRLIARQPGPITARDEAFKLVELLSSYEAAQKVQR